MGRINGRVQIAGLPPHTGLNVSICFFAVADDRSPPPHNGDPSAEDAVDCEQIFDEVDLGAEAQTKMWETPFSLARPPGYYYIQVRTILFRRQGERNLAQIEQFFFGRRPLLISEAHEDVVTFPVQWPDLPVEALHEYGAIQPQRKRPWWRVW